MSTVRRIIEGTWEEIAAHADALAGHRLRVEVIDSEPAAAPTNGHAPRNLAELLGDYIGAAQGTGDALSERTGERFTEHLAQKKRESRL